MAVPDFPTVIAPLLHFVARKIDAPTPEGTIA